MSAVIPTAGRASRMEKFKPLLPFYATTLIDRAIANAAPVCAEIVVVAGYRADDLIRHLQRDDGERYGDRLRLVRNDEWERGMLSSIQRGALEVTGEYFFVAPADMPYLAPDIYAALASRPPEYSLFPEHNGRRGHPVLISSRLIPELRQVVPEEAGSMRAFLSEYPSETHTIADDSIFIDIDTIEDYRVARGRNLRGPNAHGPNHGRANPRGPNPHGPSPGRMDRRGRNR